MFKIVRLMKKTNSCRVPFLSLFIIFLTSYHCLGQIKPLFTLSTGYGQSYGGLGVFGQFHPIPEIGLHAGVGYFPSSAIADYVPDVVLFGGGLKIYAPLDLEPIYPYMDFQYGGIGVEAAESNEFYSGWGEYYGSYYEEWVVLMGPSVLFGGEVRFELSDNFGGGFLGALGLAYALNDVDWLDQKLFLTLDLGLSLYFGQP